MPPTTIPNRIGVIGAGATGGYLAARLARAGLAVTLVARGESLRHVRQHGLEVVEPDGERFVAMPREVIGPTDPPHPVDLLLFCTKSYDTGSAAQTAASMLGPGNNLLCLQNGVKNEELLAQQVGVDRLLAGVLYVGAERVGTGHIRCRTVPHLSFGPYQNTHPLAEGLAGIKTMFEYAGIDCQVQPDILTAKWQKFLFNCGLNPLTALTHTRLDNILASESGKRLFEALVDEAISVAVPAGAPLHPDAREQVMMTAAKMPISSSMAEDLKAGRRMELDAFSGYVQELGRLRGVPTPVTNVVLDLLTTIDSNRGPS